MENNFKKIMEDSKKKVFDLTDRLLCELTRFFEDIKKQEAGIEQLGNSISEINDEIEKSQETASWLNNLKEMIEGDIFDPWVACRHVSNRALTSVCNRGQQIFVFDI